MARRIESLLLDGPAGKLETLLEEPEDRAPDEACLLCHPHPLFGGTMHNKVVYRMARALRTRGSVVLRFNFRGVGRSHGEHGEGIGEMDDARAALDLASRPLSVDTVRARWFFIWRPRDPETRMHSQRCRTVDRRRVPHGIRRISSL